jgi:hypothetical protein
MSGLATLRFAGVVDHAQFRPQGQVPRSRIRELSETPISRRSSHDLFTCLSFICPGHLLCRLRGGLRVRDLAQKPQETTT